MFGRTKMRLIFETLVCRLFRDRVQLRSGLVDLVVGVRSHGGGGHRFTLPCERFVGLVAEDVAEVGDRCGDFREARRAEGIDGETGDDRRRFVASEPGHALELVSAGGPRTRVLTRSRGLAACWTRAPRSGPASALTAPRCAQRYRQCRRRYLRRRCAAPTARSLRRRGLGDWTTYLQVP